MAAWIAKLTFLGCRLSSLPTIVLILAWSCGAEPGDLTSWDRQFLYEKLGIGPTGLSMLRLSVEESRCMHSLINRFGPEEKLVDGVARFLDDLASHRAAGGKSSTKCPL